MLSATEAQIVADLFYRLDIQTRFDLSRGLIADERDYVSRLAHSLSYPFGVFNHYSFNSLKLSSKWFARVNDGTMERRFGCDSMIVFQVEDQVKVGLFEAKWPRVIKDPGYHWDRYQKSVKRSHFTHQIERQAKWSKQAAIWEMFFLELSPGTVHVKYDLLGSSCVHHKIAKRLITKDPSLKMLWENKDIEALLSEAQHSPLGLKIETNLKTMINGLLNCSLGKPVKVDPGQSSFELRSNDKKMQVRIPMLFGKSYDEPLSRLTTDREYSGNENIGGFMEENGLSFFQFVKVDKQ
ncbi:MAG: hypothetical protein WC615_00225 [Mucilaginibacter sp.]|jgi:hypothetical protein|uniref:hypothetical protein n=1 Tax=Mucilaginibacter sp. TaxID=1882438 RepID=UPI003565F177